MKLPNAGRRGDEVKLITYVRQSQNNSGRIKPYGCAVGEA